MAKISARGAREIARFTAEGKTGTRWLWVLASDGRVLNRIADTGGVQSGYTVRATITDPAQITADGLRKIIERDGMTITVQAPAPRR